MVAAGVVPWNLHETVKMHTQQKTATSKFEVSLGDTVIAKAPYTSNHANR